MKTPGLSHALCEFLLLALFCAMPVAATETEAEPNEPAPQPVAPAVPRVVEVVSDIPGRPNEAGLGDRFTLTVENLSTALDEAGGCQHLVLFLGGLPVPDTPPERCDPDNGHVGFLLERPGQASRTWSALLGRPTHFKKPVRLTVGAGPDRSYPTLIQPGGKEFQLVVLRRSELLAFLAILAVTSILIFRLSQRTALLRRPGPEPLGQRPFSLARFQLAFWSILTVEAYLFVWLISGNLDTITESVLALVGMGSATALGGSLIDSNAEPAPAKHASRGFLTDILSDTSGICIQRFQMVAWTLILGLIFCVSVYKTLEMPEFSLTLLSLMGICSGTYLAFKFPEQQSVVSAKNPHPEPPSTETSSAAP